MDLLLIVVIAALLILALPLVAFVQSLRAARLSKQMEENWRQLTQRVHSLESEQKEFRRRFEQQNLALQGVIEKLGRSSAEAAGPEGAPAEPPRPVAAEVPPEPALAAPSIRRPEVGPSQTPGAVFTEPPAQASSLPIVAKSASTPSVAPPSVAVPEADKRRFEATSKRVWNLEEVLGAHWLNKLGMIGIVVGMALLMAREMREFGPAGKVLVGFVASAVFLATGVVFERRERWRILARAAMGGGWALLYFTIYAMNHIAAARVLTSEAWDFVLLILAAVAMVAHTLRYHSRVITGLAFLLAFATINISRAGPTSLIAGAILAAALVVIVIRRRWFDLEVLAIVAVFLNHYYWLRPIIEPMHRHRHPFPEFIPSAVLLIFYWLIFRVSYLLRRELSEDEEKISTLGALLNSFLLLGVMKYQSVHPEWAFRVLLVLGAIEFTLGQLPLTRRRRTAFVILSTIGATLVAVAFPFRYSGLMLPILWLAEAEALFLAGVFTREILFRWLGIAVQVLVAGHMFFIDTAHLGALREAKAADFSDPRRATAFFVAALVMFANAHWVPRHWPDLLKAGFEKKFYPFQSYLAGCILLAAVWAVCSEPWQAVGFAGGALLLAFVGARGKIDELSVLANAFAVLGFLRVVLANFAVVEVSYVNVPAVVSISLAAALLYLASRWIGLRASIGSLRIPDAYVWIATFIVVLLAWYQLRPASVALAWSVMGLVLFQLGFERRSTSLRLQSYLLFLASFTRVFFVNFNAEESAGQLSPRLYTALPLALLFYFVYARLADHEDEFLATDRRLHAAGLHLYLGTITVAAAMRFELSPDWIAAAWSALVCLFVLIAWHYGRRIFVGQALLLGFAVFFRTLFHNLYQRSYFPPRSAWSGGWITTGTAVALIFVALFLARRLKLPRPQAPVNQGSRLRNIFGAIARNPAHVFFFVSFLLLTGLLFVELHAHGMATVAWGVEAVGVFLLALALKERIYRLSALALLLVCVGKIVFVDVWGLTPLDRDLTFIILGVALFSVSYLYTRYPEVLRAYL